MSTLPSDISCFSDAPVTPIRALYIAEILDMILDELVNDKCSICHLAFTCKAIAEPALDRLWALNHSLEPFISLLPKELTLDVRLQAEQRPLRPDVTLVYRKTLSCNMTPLYSLICPKRSGQHSTNMLRGRVVYMRKQSP